MANVTGASLAPPASSGRNQDFGFAAGIVIILSVLFVPLPSILIDIGLSLSIALSVLILMVALWIQKPIEFTAFPTILLIATMVRLALNIATTRLVLSNGQEGHLAAGHVIAGFADFVMGGDFVIGIIVFSILITVNFLVITKGASRIAEVGARFSLDAMPGKQMAIDADLASGLINEKEATRRRRELEEESAFFGAMDGASKFVRGDAIAGLIITGINAFGGLVIGILRHDMTFSRALEVYWKLSVGDGLVTQIPALIVSLAAGLLVSKGGARESANIAVLGQLSRHPRAMLVSGSVMGVLALAPSLPFVPFALLSGVMLGISIHGTRREESEVRRVTTEERTAAATAAEEARNSVKELLRGAEVELRFGKQLSGFIMRSGDDLAHRVARIRRKFAKQYGFIIPEIRISDEVTLPAKSYEMLVHGTVVSSGKLRPGDVLVVVGNGPPPSVTGDETLEPAFGLKAMWIPEMYGPVAKREGFAPIDNTSVLLTHLAETLRMNLSHLLSYKDMRGLLDRLEPEYQRLLDEIAPSQISHSTLLAVLKALLAERISIRNLHLILEAVAEVSPFVKKADLIADHVRIRLSAQICGDFAEGGVLKVLRLGTRWDNAFYQAIRRDNKGEVVEFDFDPKLIEEFGKQLSKEAQRLTAEGHQYVVVSAAEVRPYVKMAIERLLPAVPVISHAEISRGIQTQFLGTVG